MAGPRTALVGMTMRHTTTSTLYDYWNGVRQQRFAPHRFEIEPAQIGHILPETMIIERRGVGDYRFRLAGTRICERCGMEFRGLDMLDLFSRQDAPAVMSNLEVIASQGAVALFHIQSSDAYGHTVIGEMIVLPLLHAPESVDRFLAAWSFEDNAVLQPGGPTLKEHMVLDYELVWPRGRPTPIVTDATPAAPLLSNVRHARIVRVNQRQFRVYDGGRAQQPCEEP